MRRGARGQRGRLGRVEVDRSLWNVTSFFACSISSLACASSEKVGREEVDDDDDGVVIIRQAKKPQVAFRSANPFVGASTTFFNLSSIFRAPSVFSLAERDRKMNP